MAQEKKPGERVQYYNHIFTLDTVKDDWKERKRLTVQHVTLRPLQPAVITKVVQWLKNPEIRESFVPAFPEKEIDLQKYFTHPARDYFGIYYNEQPVGIVGGENIDPVAGKLEMKKLVGESGLQGKGIGKRATTGIVGGLFPTCPSCRPSPPVRCNRLHSRSALAFWSAASIAALEFSLRS